MDTAKTYLGDGAYAQFDGYSVILTAENGIHATDTIILDPEVLHALLKFSQRVGLIKAPSTSDQPTTAA